MSKLKFLSIFAFPLNLNFPPIMGQGKWVPIQIVFPLLQRLISSKTQSYGRKGDCGQVNIWWKECWSNMVFPNKHHVRYVGFNWYGIVITLINLEHEIGNHSKKKNGPRGSVMMTSLWTNKCFGLPADFALPCVSKNPRSQSGCSVALIKTILGPVKLLEGAGWDSRSFWPVFTANPFHSRISSSFKTCWNHQLSWNQWTCFYWLPLW